MPKWANIRDHIICALNLMDPYAKGCVQWQLRISYSDSYAMNLVTWKLASQDCSPLYTNTRVRLLLQAQVVRLRSYNLYTLSRVILILWILCSCGSYVQDPEVHHVRTCSPLMQTKWKVCKNKDALGRVILCFQFLATTSHWHWLDTVWRWFFITSAQTEVATHNQEEQLEHVL